jgi:hypothetical protein
MGRADATRKRVRFVSAREQRGEDGGERDQDADGQRLDLQRRSYKEAARVLQIDWRTVREAVEVERVRGREAA